MTAQQTKQRAALLSLSYNIVVTAAKIVAAMLTRSVSLLSESVHSFIDIVSSAITLVSVKEAARPPDEDHPYGHGKIETLAGFGESILLLEIVIYILYEAVQRLMSHASLQRIEVGLWVMGAGSVGSLIVGRYVATAGRTLDSIALQSNGRHLMIDFWTSVGVFATLVATYWTGWFWLDAAFALVLAVGISRSAWGMLTVAFQQLIDRTLPDEELHAVHAVLQSEPDLIGYHRLRARHSGHFHYVDVHVVVPNDWSAVQAHAIADRIEKRINEALEPAQTVVHVDPFDAEKARL